MANRRPRNNKKLLVVLILAAIIMLLSVSILLINNNSPSNSYYVTYIVDGDTFIIETGEFVRLIGVNTPEKNQTFYNESKDYLYSLIMGKQVKLISDEGDKDRYGRILRYVYVADENSREIFVNYELVRKGYAVPLSISPNVKYKTEIQEARELCLQEKINLCGMSQNYAVR